MWRPTKRPATIPDKGISTRLALIAALDSDGNIWFSLTHATTDSEVMTAFLYHLCMQLDLELPGWREDSVVLLDGAKYHTSIDTRSIL